jgi:hypothetical protein
MLEIPTRVRNAAWFGAISKLFSRRRAIGESAGQDCVAAGGRAMTTGDAIFPKLSRVSISPNMNTFPSYELVPTRIVVAIFLIYPIEFCGPARIKDVAGNVPLVPGDDLIIFTSRDNRL